MPARSAAIELDAGERLVISRVLDAPRALVFDAWTKPEHVMRWWGPAGFENTRCDIDLKVGGEFRLYMRAPDASVHMCRGVFAEIIRPERIVYEGDAMEGHPCGAGLPPKARVTITFEEEGGGTRITIDTRFEAPAARLAAKEAGYAKGWIEAFERLAEELRA